MSEDLGPVLEPLLKLMDKHDLLELEVAREGMTVRLKKKCEEARKEIVALPGQNLPAASLAGANDASAGASAAGAAQAPGTTTIKSPMVGTFYRQGSPESDPYIETGDTVTPDTVVCLIEAMKVFNEIKAETEGEIVEVLVNDGEAVEFGQPLFVVKPR